MNEMNGYHIEDLRPGMQARFSKTITEADIVLLAGVSGDKNAAHVNEEFAAGTPFDGRRRRAEPGRRSNRRRSPPLRPREDYYLDADLFQAVRELIEALC